LIGNEDELAQFWETLLVRLEYQEHMDRLSDLVRFLYYLGSYQIQKSYKCHIYIEEDEEHFYFTMDNLQLLSKQTVEKAIEKFCDFVEYKMTEDVVTLALKRVQKSEMGLSKRVERVVKTSVPEEPSEVISSVVPEEPSEVVGSVKKQELQTYDLMDIDTRFEFEHVLAKLQTEISLMGSSSLEIDDIDTIDTYVKELVGVLSGCASVYTIADALTKFSALLEEYSEEFLVKSRELAQMVKSFINDIATWKDMVFYTGAPSVDFLDKSIMSNVEMIRAVFVQEESSQEDLDDIFDF
jgi:hypothetical protein